MRVLVTGGGGYIGSHCVRLLSEAGIDTVVFDSFVRGDRAAVLGPCYEGDLLNPADLRSVFERNNFDAVMHFAAFVIVEESVAEPALYLQINTLGTLNLLEAMRLHGCSRLVFSSTAAVYGMPEAVPLMEEHPLRPINPYGLSKMLAESVIAYYGRMYGMRWLAFRYFNAAGREFAFPAARFREHDTHLITRVLNAAEKGGKPLQVYGNDYDTPDGTCIRDYVHVSDICQAHILALKYVEAGGESGCFNIGTGSGYSVQQVLEACRKETGRAIAFEQCGRRAGDPAVLVASSNKLRNLLGWCPQYETLESIIASAWAWHKEPGSHEPALVAKEC